MILNENKNVKKIILIYNNIELIIIDSIPENHLIQSVEEAQHYCTYIKRNDYPLLPLN